MAKTASLTSGLVAKKGQAAPAVIAHQPASDAPKPASQAKRIAMTVKLEPAQYEALKIYAAKHRTNGQDVFVAALERYLADESRAV